MISLQPGIGWRTRVEFERDQAQQRVRELEHDLAQLRAAHAELKVKYAALRKERRR